MGNVIHLLDYVRFYQRFIRPASLKETEAVAHRLLSQRFLRVDFSRLSGEEEARMLYFLSGVAYAIDGEVNQLSNSRYIFSEKKPMKNGTE